MIVRAIVVLNRTIADGDSLAANACALVIFGVKGPSCIASVHGI